MGRGWWLAACFSLTLSGCAFHTTATEWNGRVGPDDNPVYFTSTTKVGMKLFIFVPFLGDLGIDGMVDDLTSNVAEEGGNRVDVVQGETENYWYGFPPFTWLLTPVISTLTAVYEPTAEAMERDRLEREEEAAAIKEQLEESRDKDEDPFGRS